MDTKCQKVPVQIRVNMWLGLSAYEKKFNSFSEGTFSVFAEMVFHLPQTSRQNSVAQSASRSKHISFYCVTVREPSPSVREVGDNRTGGAPQILRCDRQTEAEARVLHPSKGLGVGEWLVYWPWESVSILSEKEAVTPSGFYCALLSYSVVSKGEWVMFTLFAFLSYPLWLRTESRTVSPRWNLVFIITHPVSTHQNNFQA